MRAPNNTAGSEEGGGEIKQVNCSRNIICGPSIGARNNFGWEKGGAGSSRKFNHASH